MNFDSKAQNWDDDPMKNERAKVFANEIIDYLKPDQSLNALEFGCGTGLLSFHLKDAFKSVTLVDSSEGMIKVLREKIAKSGIKNFSPIHINLLEEEHNLKDFDVVYTLMTLHHISNIQSIIKTFNSLLKTNGYLCIADLVKEDGSFHADQDNFTEHNGFDRDELSKILSKNGFDVVNYKICFEVEKKVNDEVRKYPVFLIICKKIS